MRPVCRPRHGSATTRDLRARVDWSQTPHRPPLALRHRAATPVTDAVTGISLNRARSLPGGVRARLRVRRGFVAEPAHLVKWAARLPRGVQSPENSARA